MGPADQRSGWGRFKGVRVAKERGRTVIQRGGRERERERGADKKNEETTRSVEGMPSDERRRAAARGSSLASRRPSRPTVFALAV